MRPQRGIVYLVGAGPGDPGLMTVRGLSLVRQADVIIHDRLIGHELLSAAKRGAVVIDGGKEPGRHREIQQRIDRQIIDHARQGKTVVRLKGGDPYIFGRGFEELMTCRNAGIDCIVIPGVSSAWAAPSAVGIPMTSRQLVRSVAVIAGRTASESEAQPLNYAALAGIDVISILMGRKRLVEMADSLIAAGRSPTTPAACIEWATTPRQRLTVATLGTIAQAADRDDLRPPVVTVIGEVAAFARSDAMSIPATLVGRRIVLTVANGRVPHLRERLTAAGACLVSCPMTRIVLSRDTRKLDDAVGRLHEYDWVVFGAPLDALDEEPPRENETAQPVPLDAGVYAVRALVRRLAAAGRDVRALAGCRLAAIGGRTSRALARLGIRPEVSCPDGLGVWDAMRGTSDRPELGRVLAIGGVTGDESPGHRRCVSGSIEWVPAFEMVNATPARHVVRLLKAGVDVMLFLDPRSVRCFASLPGVPKRQPLACVGGATARAAIDAGLDVAIRIPDATVDGIVTALLDHFVAGAPAL